MHKLTRQSHKLLERLRPMSAASECYSVAVLAMFFIVITRTQAYQYFLIHCLSPWGINDPNIADGILWMLRIEASAYALYNIWKGDDITIFGVKKEAEIVRFIVKIRKLWLTKK
jgi:hypothetical protein